MQVLRKLCRSDTRRLILKNRLIRKIVSLLQKRRAQDDSEKTFLILSTTGLGDTLWATPALRALRETFPTSKILVLTSSVGRAVLEHNRRIDGLFVLKKPFLFCFLSLYFRLRKERITHVISFHTSQRFTLPFSALFGAKEMIGSYGMNKGLDDLLTQAIDHEEGIHEIQRRLDLVGVLGAHTFDVSMEVFETPKEDRVAQEVLAKVQSPEYLPVIVLHPGAKDRFKQWPVSHFIALGRRLVADVGCRLVITGGQEEKSLIQEICAHIPSATPLIHLSVLELAAVLKRVNLVIANDTGPMHLAFSQKTPTISLFSPTNPRSCGPLSVASAVVLSKPPTCTPCLKKRCSEPFCLLQLGVDEVYQTALQMLYGNRIGS